MALAVTNYFDAIVSAQDAEVNAFKPNPRGLEVVLKRLGVEKHEALYIGDRAEVDAAAAAAAGISCVIISRRRERSKASEWIEVSGYPELSGLLFR